jgi:4,5-dihydroxyphthalate decarboxylase
VADVNVLRTVLADYPHTTPLKRGELTSPDLRLDFHEVAPVHRAFAPMVREEAYDFCEMAIVTCLQAIAYGRPVVLLPAVVASRFQRGCLIAHGSRPLAPADLAGKRVGVRAFTQTTGMWVRAHLAEDYGLAPDRVRWITRDGAHVEQYADPDYVEHGIGDRSLADLLRAGEIDAAVLGNDLPEDDEFVPVVPDAAALDRAWWQRNGFMPINHMVVAGRSACRRDAAAVREAYALLRRSAESVAPADGGPNPVLFGFERLRGPVEFVVEACLAQDLLPRKLTVDDVFGPARDLLGGLGD